MPDPPRTDAPRRIGPYEVLEEIGRGGMGAVYRARDTRLGRVIALKVLLGGAWASPEAVERFHREASLVARMGKHPHPSTRPAHPRGARSGQAPVATA